MAPRPRPEPSWPPDGPSDDDLVEACASGDQDGLRTLYRRHQRAAFSLALRITSDAWSAEEVVQEAFLRVWRSAAGYEPRGAFPSWLLTITRRIALDELRRRGRDVPQASHADDPGRFADGAPGPEGDTLAAERAAQVRRAMAGISAEQRAVLELIYYGGLSQNEVSRRLGIPLGTVKSRVRLALARLRVVVLEAERP